MELNLSSSVGPIVKFFIVSFQAYPGCQIPLNILQLQQYSMSYQSKQSDDYQGNNRIQNYNPLPSNGNYTPQPVSYNPSSPTYNAQQPVSYNPSPPTYYAQPQGQPPSNVANYASRSNSNQNYFGNPQSHYDPHYAPQQQEPQNNNYLGIQGNQDQRLNEGEFYSNDKDGLYGDSRIGFIRKVYTLLTLQLLATAGIGYWAYNNAWFHQTFVNIASIIILSVLAITLSCFVACCMRAFQACALPIFIAFTLVMSLLVAIAICAYSSSSILLAVGITMALVIALTIYACVTKTDFTGCGPYLMMILLVLIMFGFVAIFWRNPIVQLIYSCLGALVFSLFLIYDTQLVVGNGKFSYSLDDAYFAAIQLYLDVINLFLNILTLTGGS